MSGPVHQETGPERELRRRRPPVLQGQCVEVSVDRHDLAAPVRGDLLDHGSELGEGLDGASVLRRAPIGREHVGPVAVSHASTLWVGTDGAREHTPGLPKVGL